MLRREEVGPLIDHTLLREDATESEIVKVCSEAKANRFATVCIRPQWVSLACKELAGSSVKAITVVGFPSGEPSTSEKVKELVKAVSDGAQEIDFVINRTLLKGRKLDLFLREIAALVQAAGAVPTKAILETSELTDEEKIIASTVCAAAGCSFVKTSTGYSKSGATAADVKLMRSVVGPGVGVKASGGVRTFEDALRMVEAGANRLGTSNGLQIVSGGSPAGGSY